jgi:2-polyprenyl-6-methoxyphenol hydroxylase-like FAD-dependent oxidoreductase
VEEVLWCSRFRVHHRVVDSYRAGRVLLAGDAAHVHSPAGGQGMNTGILDAMALAEALAIALTTGNEEALNSYGRIRRPIALQVVALADRLTRIATVSPRLRPMRNTLLKLLAYLPAFRRRLAWQLSGLMYRRSGQISDNHPGNLSGVTTFHHG